jgi:hypothetical protein
MTFLSALGPLAGNPAYSPLFEPLSSLVCSLEGRSLVYSRYVYP